MRIASTAPTNTGTSIALRKNLIRLLTSFIFPTVALLVPSMGASICSSLWPKRLFQFVSRILFHMETSESIAGTQHAAERRVAVLKVSLSGAGITYILLADPPRIGEKGPETTSQVRPHKDS